MPAYDEAGPSAGRKLFPALPGVPVLCVRSGAIATLLLATPLLA